MHGILGLGSARRIAVRFLFVVTAALAISAAPLTASANTTITDVSIRETFGNRLVPRHVF